MLSSQGAGFFVELGNLVSEGFGSLLSQGDGLTRSLEPVGRGPEPGGDMGLLHLPVDPAFAGRFLLRFERG